MAIKATGTRGPRRGTAHRGRKPPTVPESTIITPPKREGVISLPSTLTVKQLAEFLQRSPVDVIKELMKNGIMATINQLIDYDTAAIIATDMGYEVQEEVRPEAEATLPALLPEGEAGLLKRRPAVVTIMGHVDHGKTTLLDSIRQTNVTAQEVGGITQHLGAYQVEVHGQHITFLDTPGHEAFTAMRARGAQVTDIAVLVVAADDGIMPQTVEAIDHSRAAGVPIVVALNKIDVPNANPERVKRQLAELGLMIEEWGGDVVCVPTSAKKKEGIDDLLEHILLVAEMQELKADPHRHARGIVIEAELDKTKGPLATVLIQEGTLRLGDRVVVGSTWGRVKALYNDRGKHIKRAEPATPVEVLGLNDVPQVGDGFQVMPDEKTARAIALDNQARKERETAQPAKMVSLDELFAQIQAGEVKELNLILKTDVQGSIEPIKSSLERMEHDGVKVRVLHSGTGSITESDVLLAIASKGIILGFNSRPEPGARRLAETRGVDIRFYDVIYHLVEDVDRALAGMMEPTYSEVIEGHAEVRQVFRVAKGAVAGVYVLDGKVSRSAQARLMRQGEKVYEGKVASLRHFKEDVREMSAGFECGVGLESYAAFEVGDIIELYRLEANS